MANDNTTWILMLLGAGLTTWLIVSGTAHLRDNAGPSLNEMGREMEVGSAQSTLAYARERVQAARDAKPFDPEQARRALQSARWALDDAAEVMDKATPQERFALVEEMEKLEEEAEALARQKAKAE